MSGVFEGRLVTSVWSPDEVRKSGRSVQQYEVVGTFRYLSDEYGEIVVPDGFVTDFASIPRQAWFLLDPEDPVILYASVVHDWLYSVGGAMRYTREESDGVLREAMEASGASGWQRQMVYRSVRMFGGSHWPQDAQGNKVPSP